MCSIPFRSVHLRILFLAGLAAAEFAPRAFAGSFTLTGSPAGTECVDAGATLLLNGKVLLAGGANSAGDSATEASAEVYDPAAGVWSITGSLTSARRSHTMTLLQDGTVLAAGGSNESSGALSSVEIYDPAGGIWKSVAPMNAARRSHTATRLRDGRIFVLGGESSLNRPEIYNPQTDAWTLARAPIQPANFSAVVLLPSGELLAVGDNASAGEAEVYMPASDTWLETTGLVSSHLHGTLTVLQSGTVLLAGGELAPTGAPASAEVYDRNANQWTQTGSLAMNRENPTASLLPNGSVIVVGGTPAGQVGVPIAAAEQYDPSTGKWTESGSANVARAAQTATMLPNGRLLLVSGVEATAPTAELYDSAAPFLGLGGVNPLTRQDATFTLLPSGKVLMAGGLNDSGQGSLTCSLYDPRSDSWSPTGSMLSIRYLHSATLLPNGRVLVAYGSDPSGAYAATAEIYDPVTSAWAPTGAPLTHRILATATLLPSGQVLAAGGLLDSGDGAQCEFYDPATGVWSTAPSLDQPRSSGTATLLPSGKVLLAAGRTPSINGTNTTILYDPINNVWEPGGALGVARFSHSATLLPSGQVLVTGGYDANGNALRSSELYNPTADVWTPAADLQESRVRHTATLLVDGRVLATGGNAAGGAELYDPGLDRWATGLALNGNRGNQSAVRLGTGKVLISGGLVDGNLSGATTLYNPGLGYPAAAQAQISGISAPLVSGQALTVTGTGFGGFGSDSSGGARDSSANYPVALLESLANGQALTLPTVYQTSSSFTTKPIFDFPAGYARLTVFVNGIPSPSTLLPIVSGAPAVYTDRSVSLSASDFVLYAKVVAYDSPASVYFEYSADPNLATFLTTAPQAIPASHDLALVTFPITVLSPHTNYYYRTVAQNASGVTRGGIVSLGTPNSAPTAADGVASVPAGSPQVITLPFQSTDLDGDTITITSVTSVNGAILSKSGNGVSVQYSETFSGQDHITYMVSDGYGGNAGGTVTVTVTRPAPSAVSDTFASGNNKLTPLTLDVLANDISSAPDTFVLTAVTSPRFGSARLSADKKSIIYTPRVAFATLSATETFSYTVTDSTGLTGTAGVQISNPANQLKGTFDALLTGGPNPGYISAVLTGNESFTGKLRIGSATYSFKGAFGLNNVTTVTAGPFTLAVTLNPATSQISVTVSQGGNTYAGQLSRESFNTLRTPAPQAGVYTALLQSILNSSGIPSTATATVADGKVTDIVIVKSGIGYPTPPLVTITSPAGSGATATAELTEGKVTAIHVTSGGSKYPADGVVVTLDTPEQTIPSGLGYATFKVTPAGAVTVVGKLGDGVSLSAGGFVKTDGSFAFFATLPYKISGALHGQVKFEDLPNQSDFDGNLSWTKPAQTKAGIYRNGFSVSTILVGSLYTPPAKGERALDFSTQPTESLTLSLGYGDLPLILSDTIDLSPKNRVVETSANTDGLSVKINPKTGLFTGSFTSVFFEPPTGQKALKANFSGAILQKRVLAAGYFLAPLHSGAVVINRGN